MSKNFNLLHAFQSVNQDKCDLNFIEWSLTELFARVGKSNGDDLEVINEHLVNMGWQWNDSKTVAPLKSISQVYNYMTNHRHGLDEITLNGLVEDLDYVLTELDYVIDWNGRGFEIKVPI